MPDALKKPPDLIGKACLPQGMGALLLDQVAVFKHVTSLVVDDSSDKMMGIMVLNGKLVCCECIANSGRWGGCRVDGCSHEFGRNNAVDHVHSLRP
jgi:hypothetical protein